MESFVCRALEKKPQAGEKRKRQLPVPGMLDLLRGGACPRLVMSLGALSPPVRPAENMSADPGADTKSDPRFATVVTGVLAP
jgi:hypothetical protein